MDVPSIVLMATSLVFHADVMAWPGAKRSVHVPKFENDARASVSVEALTWSASMTRAGELKHAEKLLFPEAMAYVTPLAIEARTASSMLCVALPPRLMFA